jgi:hypothetical protein
VSPRRSSPPAEGAGHDLLTRSLPATFPVGSHSCADTASRHRRPPTRITDAPEPVSVTTPVGRQHVWLDTAIAYDRPQQTGAAKSVAAPVRSTHRRHVPRRCGTAPSPKKRARPVSGAYQALSGRTFSVTTAFNQ